MLACRICGSDHVGAPVKLREMMYGTGEEFDYSMCLDCDTFQIVEIPEDLSRYYPNNYYSFEQSRSSIKEWGRRQFKRLFRRHAPPQWVDALDRKASVLDVGCGSGALLHDMKQWGFRRLAGYDPFCSPGTRQGILISNRRPEGQQFGVVMMHHSLEHVPDPSVALQDATRWMAPDGKLVIRIPVRQGWAWREYGLNWAHLDPPRHLYHWTVDGFTRFASRQGFEVVAQGFDGTSFSLAYSPQIAAGLSMTAPLEASTDELWKQADALNAAGDGDAAWFILQRQSV